jgi:hypothetical protein
LRFPDTCDADVAVVLPRDGAVTLETKECAPTLLADIDAVELVF